MRITSYNLVLQSEDRIPCLVKENTKNYSNLSGITTPEEAVRIVNTVFNANKQPEEHCYIIALRCNRIIGVFDASHGVTDGALVTPKEVFTRLLLSSTTSFVFLHNHPSGDAVPSGCDIELTKRIIAASEIMGVTFLDHIIIGENDLDFYSFASRSDLFNR